MQVSEKSPFVTITQADLEKQSVWTEKLRQAAQKGFFFLEIPTDCQPLVDHALQHVDTCYASPQVKQLSLDGFSGFHDRKSFQVESLYLEKKHWEVYLPKEFKALSLRMYDIGLDLLKKTLNTCQIPEKDWDLATGDSTSQKGLVHYTLNHYRPEKQCEGLAAHRDFGQITVLFTDTLGLEAKIDGQWQGVPVKKNHFIINFGRTLETFVNNPNALTAAWHRVPKLAVERTSFGIFIDNKKDAAIFKRESDGSLTKVSESYEQYLNDSFEEYYPEGDIKNG